LSDAASDAAWQSGGRRLESFRYPAMHPGAISPENSGFAGAEGFKARNMALQREIAAAVDAARKQGFQQGTEQGKLAASEALDQERAAIQEAIRDFAACRTDYFRRLESEAVRLALSIARKVLHREAQMDPLLLSGVVRVALDQLQAGSRLVLRTAPDAVKSWTEFCAKNLREERQIEVSADENLKAYQCVLEAEAGKTEISLDAQLGEIESGFFDLLRKENPPTP
jgi:flagellar assembly protein FliH